MWQRYIPIIYSASTSKCDGPVFAIHFKIGFALCSAFLFLAKHFGKLTKVKYRGREPLFIHTFLEGRNGF